MAKKSKSGVDVDDEAHEATPQAAQTAVQPRKRKGHGKAVGGASGAPGRTNGNVAGADGASAPRKGKQGLATPWPKGVSGNPKGRARGSRHKLSENFILALHDSFEEHGDAVIAAVIQDNPAEYLRIIASIVPKQFGIEEGSQDCFLKVWQSISDGTASR
jgi:hypothetical protein